MERGNISLVLAKQVEHYNRNDDNIVGFGEK